MTLGQFWRTAPVLSRVALVTAGAAAVSNVGSYAGLSLRGRFEWLAVLQVVVMALLFAMFLRLGYRNWLALRRPARDPWDPSPPRYGQIVRAAALAGLYVVVCFVWIAYISGAGGGADMVDGREVWVGPGAEVRPISHAEWARYTGAELRLFSAGWLFFALIVAAWAPSVEAAIRDRRAAARRAAT